MRTVNPSAIMVIDHVTAAVELTQDKWALIDVVDIPLISAYKWTAQECSSTKGKFYATTRVRGLNSASKSGKTYIHRMILGLVENAGSIDVDHKDGDPLNNRRSNLRSCTRLQNMRNRKKRRNTSSQWHGVCFDKTRGKWMACVKVDGRFKSLGRHDTEIDAAIAYYEAAMKLDPVFYGSILVDPRKVRDGEQRDESDAQ